MRWDYLTRYESEFGEGGFRRLMTEGYCCNRTSINYLPSVTAVGHASIYTGSVPALTGITGNNIVVGGEMVYCCTDTTVSTVASPFAGNVNMKAGQMSPRNLLSTTIVDELRLATNFRSKTISVSLKDRAAILPGGHTANAAYWFDDASATFISSTFYMDALPKWADDFNRTIDRAKMLCEIGHSKDSSWRLLRNEEEYRQSAAIGNGYEKSVGGDLKDSPCGITLTFGMAKAAIEGERLGSNEQGTPDFLAVSISSTDIVGHAVGPNSIWQEDLFLRLDAELENFMRYLDATVGRDSYILFLTADHAANHNAEYLRHHRLPAPVWVEKEVQTALDEALRTHLGATRRVAQCIDNFRVRMLGESLAAQDISCAEAERIVLNTLRQLPIVKYAFTFNAIPDYIPQPLRQMAVNGYCPDRCGDIQIIPQTGATEYGSAYSPQRGTSHSMWCPYDTHIPLIFMGKNIPSAQDEQSHRITDIAATLASLLRIQQPSACVGENIIIRQQQK